MIAFLASPTAIIFDANHYLEAPSQRSSSQSFNALIISSESPPKKPPTAPPNPLGIPPNPPSAPPIAPATAPPPSTVVAAPPIAPTPIPCSPPGAPAIAPAATPPSAAVAAPSLYRSTAPEVSMLLHTELFPYNGIICHVENGLHFPALDNICYSVNSYNVVCRIALREPLWWII